MVAKKEAHSGRLAGQSAHTRLPGSCSSAVIRLFISASGPFILSLLLLFCCAIFSPILTLVASAPLAWWINILYVLLNEQPIASGCVAHYRTYDAELVVVVGLLT